MIPITDWVQRQLPKSKEEKTVEGYIQQTVLLDNNTRHNQVGLLTTHSCLFLSSHTLLLTRPDALWHNMLF